MGEPSANKSDIKDCILAAYELRKEETMARIEGQKTVLGWLLTLTGAVAVALITELPKDGVSVLSSLLHIKPITEEPRTTVAFILAGYVVGVEVLISYWICQFSHFVRCRIEVESMETLLKKLLSCSEYHLLIWGEEPKCTKRKILWRIWSSLPSSLQALSLYVMAVIGIVGVWLLPVNSAGSIFATGEWVVRGITLALLLVLLGLFSIHIHLWFCTWTNRKTNEKPSREVPAVG